MSWWQAVVGLAKHDVILSEGNRNDNLMLEKELDKIKSIGMEFICLLISCNDICIRPGFPKEMASVIEVSACLIKSNTVFAPVKDMFKEERKKDIQMSFKRLKWPC